MDEILVGVLTTITIALVQVIKQARMESNIKPLISLGVGLVLGLGAYFLGYAEMQTALLSGLASGLAASGLYDVGKGIVMTAQDDETEI